MKISIRIQEEDFSLDAEIAALAQAGDPGAVASFTGHVRKEGDLSVLTLEHYPRMTEDEILRIAEQAAARWPLSGATIIHRIGRLAPGERIVLVAVAATHRQAAFQACEFLMDFLKTHAPFWKEETRGHQRHWISPHAGDDAAAERWRK
jgi:molybdopterin synthase catalytic subunit